MRKLIRLSLIVALVVLLFSGYANANIFGENITIYDKQSAAPQGTPSVVGRTGIGVGQEDQEVEPGAAVGQEWDLEGFFLKGNELTMVGGYNFLRTDDYAAGDVFIDTNGDAVYGGAWPNGSGGNDPIKNIFGYEYVLDMDFGSKTYSVFSINADSILKTVTYDNMDEANPWRYKYGGTLVGDLENLSMNYQTGLSNGDVDLYGGSHNAVGVDLSFLGSGSPFTAHFTMRCGNDNLMGSGTTTAPVPEPATMILFGSGLIGLAGIGRRNMNRNTIRQEQLV